MQTITKNLIEQALLAQCNEAICFAKRRQTTAVQLMAEEVLTTCSNIADHCGLIDLNQIIGKAQVALEKGDYITLVMPPETATKSTAMVKANTQLTVIEKAQLASQPSEIDHLKTLYNDLQILRADNVNGSLMLVSTNGLAQSKPKLIHMPQVITAIEDFCNQGQQDIHARFAELNYQYNPFELLDIFGNPAQSMGVTCTGCQTDLTTANAGGYRSYCEKCVDAIPKMPHNKIGCQLHGTYPNFEWVEKRQYIPAQ